MGKIQPLFAISGSSWKNKTLILWSSALRIIGTAWSWSKLVQPEKMSMSKSPWPTASENVLLWFRLLITTKLWYKSDNNKEVATLLVNLLEWSEMGHRENQEGQYLGKFQLRNRICSRSWRYTASWSWLWFLVGPNGPATIQPESLSWQLEAFLELWRRLGVWLGCSFAGYGCLGDGESKSSDKSPDLCR